MIASVEGFKYFNENWANCLPKWVKYHRIGLHIGDNNTNNPVESVNNQLKHFIKLNSKISICLQQTLSYVTFLCNKYDYCKIVQMTKKTRYQLNDTISDPIIQSFF